MRENKGFFIACGFISLTWLYAAYDADHSNALFAMLLGLGGFVSWLGLFVLALYRVIKRNHLRWQKRLAPFWLVLTPLVAYIGCSLVINLFSAPNWLLVECYDFTGSDSLLFKKDGEYQCWRGSPLGRSAIVRGRYERHDSLLVLQPNTNGETRVIASMAIRPYAPFLRRENPVVKLVALDSAGTTIGIFHIKERTD
ncbi:MAG: hypothetical protein EOO63_14395 [Hymenobacter sp.]|nr:MAG: hypothetical protein EOO63_14395 [Hymenobacter sp.]